MDGVLQDVNLIEGCWWILVAFLLLVAGRRRCWPIWHVIGLCICLLCFGVSDFIEIYTGA